MEIVKKCTKCGELKSLINFYREKTQCRTCAKEIKRLYYLKNIQ